MDRDDNGAGSGRGPFKKLNGARRVGRDEKIPKSALLHFFFFGFFIFVYFYFYYIKINIFHKK